MNDKVVTLRDIEHLAGVLEGLDLEEQDRASLQVVFTLAGQAQAEAAKDDEDDEVSGFAFDTYMTTGGNDPYGGGGLFKNFENQLPQPPQNDMLNPQPLPP